MKTLIAGVLVAAVAGSAYAQPVPPEEAAKRLEERKRQRQAEAEKPATRAEVEELRSELKKLRAEVAELREGLAKQRTTKVASGDQGQRAPRDLKVMAGLEVGQMGHLVFPPWDGGRNAKYAFHAEEIIGPDQMLVRVHRLTLDGPIPEDVMFLVKGVPTSGIVDGKRLTLDGVYEVTGTQKHFGRTYFLVEKRSEQPSATSPAPAPR